MSINNTAKLSTRPNLHRLVPSLAVVGRARRAVAVAAAVAGLSAAAVMSAPSALAATTVTTHPVLANHELALLNKERAAHHLPALHMSAKLISSAYHHNLKMSSSNVMSHQEAGEQSMGNRVLAVHYNWSTCGENIGWTTNLTSAGARELETMMYNEKAPNDGHKLNILSKSYRDVGISIVIDNRTHRMWLTEDFGHVM